MKESGEGIKRPSVAGMQNMGHLGGMASDDALMQGHAGVLDSAKLAAGAPMPMVQLQGAKPGRLKGRGMENPKVNNAQPSKMAKVKGGSYGQ